MEYQTSQASRLREAPTHLIWLTGSYGRSKLDLMDYDEFRLLRETQSDHITSHSYFIAEVGRFLFIYQNNFCLMKTLKP